MKKPTRAEKVSDPLTNVIIFGSLALMVFVLGGVGALINEFCDWGQSPWLGQSSTTAMLMAIPIMLLGSIAYAVDSGGNHGNEISKTRRNN